MPTRKLSEVPAEFKCNLVGDEYSIERCESTMVAGYLAGSNDRYKEAAVAAGVGAAVGAVTAAIAKAALCAVSICRMPRDFFLRSQIDSEAGNMLFRTSPTHPTRRELLEMRTSVMMAE